MAPLGLLGQTPTGTELVGVAGQVKYTGIQIRQTDLHAGKLCVYDDKGQYYIGIHGKSFKKFKLSKNIKEIRARNDTLTIVLKDEHQIIAKQCHPGDVKVFENCLNNIKNAGSLKGWNLSKQDENALPKSPYDSKQNTILQSSRKLLMKVKKHSPVPSQGRPTSPDVSSLSQTPSKSPVYRRHLGSRLKGRILASPLSNKENSNDNSKQIIESFKILESNCSDPLSQEDEEVSIVTTPRSGATWSRPPGEQRSHSPSLRIGCKNSSPLGFSSIRSKSPKSKRRLIDSALSYDDFEDDLDDENSLHPAFSKTQQRSNTNASPLRPKVLQAENKSSGKSPVQEPVHKASNFYGSGKGFIPSFSRKKLSAFNWRDKGLKRQLPVASEEKKTFNFKKREKDTTETATSTYELALTGFANLGNTCYMNAILQCLLGIPVFAFDLDNSLLLSKVKQISLYRYLHNLLLAKRLNESQEKQKLILRSIKRAISNQAARFSGYMQHDAHEFLGQCLDQLKDDIIKTSLTQEKESELSDSSENQETKMLEAACPVARNFECQVSHDITCTECGNKITKEEVFYDFSLDIPEGDENTDPEDKDLQDLLQDYFEEENIGYKCEKCECETANLSHHISKLPRVMILHLKRYELNPDYTKYRKKLDTVDVPIEVNLGVLCNDETTKPVVFEKTPKSNSGISGAKRPISNESPDDVNDFLPSNKARRKLALTNVPKLSDPEEDYTSLDFKKDLERAKKLSLDAITLDRTTEDEQLEWALAESMKTTHSFGKDPMKFDDDFLPPALLELDPHNTNEIKKDKDTFTGVKGLQNGTETKTYTGLKDKKFEEKEKERSEVMMKAGKSAENGISEWLSTQEKENEQETDAALLESVTQFADEEDQLKKALEISLREYNESTTPSVKWAQNHGGNSEKVDSTRKTKSKKARLNSNAPQQKYNLIGIVSHIGDSSAAGHYISDVYDFKLKEWKSFNDSSVKKITEYEVKYGRKHCAYILFYIAEECYQAILNK